MLRALSACHDEALPGGLSTPSLPSARANGLEAAKQFLWCHGPVSRPPTLEQKFGQRRRMLLARSPLQAPACRQASFPDSYPPHHGKHLPGSAAARTQRVPGVSNLIPKPIDLLLTAERAMRQRCRA